MKTPTVAIQVTAEQFPVWERAIRDRLPDAVVLALQAVADPGTIDAAVVWNPPAGLLERMEHLKVVVSRGAGVDFLLGGGKLPGSVPLLRYTDAGIAARMAEFVVLSVLYLHRDWTAMRTRQATRVWNGELASPRAATRRIGIMGLGELGMASIERLAPFGFHLMGWSRSPKRIAGVATFSGPEELVRMAEQTDILVCLLPLTAETSGIIDGALLGRLAPGAGLVNAGRGGHVVDEALLEALDSGRVSAAVLDVFRDEPLPADHPFWVHPAITITQHSAAVLTDHEEAAAAARLLADSLVNDTAPGLVDRRRGY